MNAIEIKDLTKNYKDFRLDRLTMTLPGGCILGLIGENGAGKSTTIRLLLSMLQSDGGTVKLLGREVPGELASVREDIGVVLDEVGLPECLTVKQIDRVMGYTYAHWDSARFGELAEKFSLPENKPFKDFSRGMKMKTGIAAALSHGSKLLILDEATAGLDPVARDEVVELLGEFTREEDHSILISSHIVSDLEKLCDYVAFLHKGRLLLYEEKDVLLAKYGILHCTAEELTAVPEEAVRFKKENPYGAEALVLREAVPQGFSVSPVSIEELFVCMAKEAN